MHADVESTNVLPANNNSLEYDNLEVELLKRENDRLLELIISQDLMHNDVNTLATIANYQNMEKSYLDEYNEILELQAELSKRNDMVEKAVYNELSKKCARIENQCISLEIKLEVKNNSFSKLKDHIATLKGKSMSVGDKSENISKYVARIQELLVYVSATCPSSSKQSEKLIAVTPINNNRRVRFAKPSTSSRNTQKQVDSCKTNDCNKPLLPSTEVISSTSASGSKPPDNTKKNKLSRPTSSNKKNKVEDHLRRIKSSFNKKNHVSEPVYNANLNNVNERAKSRSAKSNKKKHWKPTGKVFTSVGYRWLPTGRTFTIDETKCRMTRTLTRITSTPIVPLKETSINGLFAALATRNQEKET
ncbi:hypothetical protein Tco_1090588 [Tanacetum coccineum]|uniref:Uncharacterized protein n=1 Tax=Tanacetum coccineum TaxID=301880 RepID=A0ABQ5I5Y6_9ASTR